MLSPSLAHLLLALIVAVSILPMLIRARNIPELYWIGAGVFLLRILRLIPLKLAGRGAANGTDD
jgi:arsenical pump membrane protein